MPCCLKQSQSAFSSDYQDLDKMGKKLPQIIATFACKFLSNLEKKSKNETASVFN